MSDCPRCHQPVKSDAVKCPACGTQLKAFGHPGIPLHQAFGTESLCKTCLYDADDTCNYPKRPYAKECTMYRDRTIPIVSTPTRYEQNSSPETWMRRNLFWLLLGGLLIVSLLLALARR
jgi:hypothetical protein